MAEILKHECGVAMIRLRKPIEYYSERYGSTTWALDRLYLLMEKQHNRGQEAAGIGVVDINAAPGYEYVYRERALGSDAIATIFDEVQRRISRHDADTTTADVPTPFVGQIYMGHLRYSTTGRSGMSYVHPFLRRNNWRSRNLLLCGNFNMTNVDEVFDEIVSRGQHPRLFSDTIVLLEQLGYALDKENHRLYHEYKDKLIEPALGIAIEDNIDMSRILRKVAPSWDGGFVICGITGSGDMFTLRDSHGIRPAFYYYDDEVVVVASERPVIQTVFNVPRSAVHELIPGQALVVTKNGELSLPQILTEGANERCSFERIYFSRGSDADIYRERKALGRNLVEPLSAMIGDDFENTVFSFIPNTAEVAFLGMVEGLEARLDACRMAELRRHRDAGGLTDQSIERIIKRHLRIDKLVIKDIKLRTFIAEGESRNDLASHVYDVTYGIVKNDADTLVVIDDSIVRGTTLKESILKMLDRLHPRRIIVVSSSPQVRYPDYYGIDMSRLAEFVAFRAAVSLLRRQGREDVLHKAYKECQRQLELPADQQRNVVKDIYAPFSDTDISREISELLSKDVRASVDILYQSIEGLAAAVPGCPGRWYFTGDYPTPGGVVNVNRAFVNFYEGNETKR